MDTIKLERWKPVSENSNILEYAGPRTAEEVFQELKHRLEGMGYLPDEYFLLNIYWQNGREIPQDADIVCTTGYGGSEGIYLDIYLTWREDNNPVRERFITGKTLGESGSDLDRMFLIASAVTKAFHGDHATPTRYMKIGGVEENSGGSVLHLSQQEQKVIIEALVEQRERQEDAMTQTEQLLRRMTGSITEYINEVGLRPLRMSDYDKAVLAIRDGGLEAFKKYAARVPAQGDGLLIEAVLRPGTVGRKMTELLIEDRTNIDLKTYRFVCEKAIDIADSEKVFFLLDRAQGCVPNLEPSFYGEMAGYAHLDHVALSKEIIYRSTNEQIAAAPPYLLELFASEPDERILNLLVKKGISGGGSAARTLHMLTYEGRNSHVARDMLQRRMWVDVHDYAALHACIENDAVEVCNLLLDGGMDFDGYQKWAEARHCCGHEETVQALADHWAELKEAETQEQGSPEAGGMTLG